MLYKRETFDVAMDDQGQNWLCVRYETTEYDKPVLVTHWWPACRVAPSGVPPVDIGSEAHDCGQGCYQFRARPFDWRTVRLINGGQTKPIKSTQEPLPCPKVRKGIPTRYARCRWQKYTKADGWTDLPVFTQNKLNPGAA